MQILFKRPTIGSSYLSDKFSDMLDELWIHFLCYSDVMLCYADYLDNLLLNLE